MDAHSNSPDRREKKSKKKKARKKHENTVPRDQRIALDIPTAADMLSVSRRHLYDLISEGRIQSTKIGDRRLIARREIERLIEGAA